MKEKQKTPSKRPERPQPSAADTRYGARLGWLTALAALIYSLINPRYGTGVLNDDAVYVITAHDFWKTALRHPLLGIKPDYPFPGLPLVLAPFAKIAAPHWGVLEWVTVGVSVCGVYLVGRLARRWLTPWESLGATFLYAVFPMVCRFSGTVMPSAYFTVAVVASVLLTTRVVHGARARWAVLLGVVAGWGALTRPEGFVLLLGVTAALAVARRPWRVWAAAGAPVLAWGLFLAAWFVSRRAPKTEFGGDLAALLAYWPQHPAEIATYAIGLVNVFVLTTWRGLRALPPAATAVLTTLCSLLSMALAAIGTRALVRERRDDRAVFIGVGVYCASYAAIHIFWHVLEPRYATPLLPFALIAMTRGLRKLGATAADRRLVAVCGFLALAIPCVVRLQGAIYHSLTNPEEQYSPPTDTLAWLAANTEPEDRMTSNIAASIDLYADRPATGLLAIDDGDEFMYILIRERMRRVVIRDVAAVAPLSNSSGDPNLVTAFYKRWLRFYPRRFPVVYENAAEGTTVAEVVPPAGFSTAFETYITAASLATANRPFDALAALDRCLQTCPELGSAWNLRGALLFMNRDLDGAEKAFLAAAARAPGSSDVLLNLANTYRQRGLGDGEAFYLRRAAAVAAQSGQQAGFEQHRSGLAALWAQGRNTLFIQTPHTGLYAQIRE